MKVAAAAAMLHSAQCCRHAQKGERGLMQAVDRDRAAERVDVHENRVGGKNLLEREIDDPDFRAGEEYPGYGGQDRRAGFSLRKTAAT
jgi:hypothetical protein